jgi:hypothetical protein
MSIDISVNKRAVDIRGPKPSAILYIRVEAMTDRSAEIHQGVLSNYSSQDIRDDINMRSSSF